jgi:thiol-disulfide isomerase/thioredoxin
MRKKIIYIVIFISFLSTSVFGDTLQDEIRQAGLQPLKKGTRLIDFQLESLDGRTVKLSSFSGKVVFLNFWATWCPPCRSEMPSMQKLYTHLKDKGLEVVAVDLQENKPAVQDFFKKYGLSFTALLDKTGQVGYTYGARSIPTTYIIDRQGFVIAGTIGGKDWYTPQIISFFESLLAHK